MTKTKWIALPLLAMTLAACASTPDREVIEQVSAARAGIEQAERADADAKSSQALATARTKLDSATRALDDGDEERALRLAEEARADAAYAGASARAASAQNAAAEIEETIRTLRSEAARR
jgi:hypothetical protein